MAVIVDLTVLRQALGEIGLHVVRPVTPAGLAAAQVGFDLQAILPGARGGLVIGDGGGRFFAGFRAAGRESDDGQPDPLNRYTERVMTSVFARVLGAAGEGTTWALRFPFGGGPAPLPIGRLGQAAGLAPPGPLGLQIHPEWGPWWAYRAFAALALEPPPETALAHPCAGCPAPCTAACPGQAITRAGLEITRCVSHRLADPGCHGSCAARLSCVVGRDVRYPEAQLRFHMSASLATIRALDPGPGSP